MYPEYSAMDSEQLGVNSSLFAIDTTSDKSVYKFGPLDRFIVVIIITAEYINWQQFFEKDFY